MLFVTVKQGFAPFALPGSEGEPIFARYMAAQPRCPEAVVAHCSP
jgi:hypothetical protein